MNKIAKIVINICRAERFFQRVLCAILAVFAFINSVCAQEPELINPTQAKAIYEELTADSVAVEEESDSIDSKKENSNNGLSITSNEKKNVTSLEYVSAPSFDFEPIPELVSPEEVEIIYARLKKNEALVIGQDSEEIAETVSSENVEDEVSFKTDDEEPIPYVEDNDGEDDDFYGEEDEDGNILTADTVAVENNNSKNPKSDSNQVIRYAKRFWDEAEDEYDKHNIDISGTKTFELKKANVNGDISHFSTEHTDCYPGFKMNQSLHLEIDGNINKNSTVHAVLDDTDDEDRKFTVTIDANKWKFVLGDFPIELEGSKFAIYTKEIRGVMAQGYFHHKVRSTFLYAQSKGRSRREQFRGAGQQQEYRLLASPVVRESEKVYIDGVKLVKGNDYQIDYDEAIIKFQQSILPIEMTRWIVVEYESEDEDMAFSRNLFGTRHEYTRSEGKTIGVSWLREFDHSSPKSGYDIDNASNTITPMRHDVYEADIDWNLGHGFSVAGEYAVSKYDPNINSNDNEDDRVITGHAASISVKGKTEKIEAGASYDKIDSKFKTIGRQDGVVELGERGLVDDIISSKLDFSYKFDEVWRAFADGEKSKTNLDNDPTKSKVDYKKFNGGFIWERNNENRFEIRSSRQNDKEFGNSINSDLTKDVSAVVYDRKVGKVKTQAKAERTAYKDDVNIASDSSVLELNFNMNSEIDDKISWSAGVSRIAVEDEIVLDRLRSETNNYQLTLNYEPSRKITVKGEFQFRREDDYYNNSREDSRLADSQFTYEPDDDFRTTFKYKVENTSKITKDPDLDPQKYILPSSLPSYVLKEDEVLNRFENPVEKTTINSTTDYQMSKNLAAYVDWRRRDIDDKKTGMNISKTDRQTYELRYTPMEKMSFTTEYEKGYSVNNDSNTESHDWLKSLQLRHEFSKGYILDATYEETNEDDIYDNKNDEYKKSKILELQRPVNKKVTLEFGLQHNDIYSEKPSREFEKRFAVTLTPSSKSQRYKFFANHKDIDAEIKGNYYEGGVTFSQLIGTDTMIDGEVKKIHSSRTNAGEGYDAVVANAKVVISF